MQTVTTETLVRMLGARRAALVVAWLRTEGAAIAQEGRRGEAREHAQRAAVVLSSALADAVVDHATTATDHEEDE